MRLWTALFSIFATLSAALKWLLSRAAEAIRIVVPVPRSRVRWTLPAAGLFGAAVVVYVRHAVDAKLPLRETAPSIQPQAA